jgi:hypothetical protein
MKSMKVRVYGILVVVILCSAMLYGQSPSSIPYQTVAKSADGKILMLQKISLRLTIHDSLATGKIVYQETQALTTDSAGNIIVKVGEGKLVSGNFADISANANAKYLQVEMDPKAGKSFSELEVKQLMTVTKTTNLLPEATAGDTAIDASDSTAIIPMDTTKAKVVSNSTLTISSVLVPTTQPTTTQAAPVSTTVSTTKPGMLPIMSQAEIDAVKPIEGMAVFNNTTHKAQIYAELNTNQLLINELFTGTFGNSITFHQSFVPSVNGKVVQVEVLVKDHDTTKTSKTILFSMPGYSQKVSVNSNPGYSWLTIILTTPQDVKAGIPTSFAINTFGVADRDFATNNLYPNGSGCCWQDKVDDLVFRIYIQPVPGSKGWQNLH